MDFSWAGIRQSVKTFWNKLSSPQKIITIAAPLLVAGALIYLITWASAPQYVAIFDSTLSETDAAAINAKLKDLKVDFKLGTDGSIMVPEQSLADIKLQLASAGLPQASKFSFDYLDTMKLGETEADRKLRFTLALQNELETTLKTLTGVQDARVHIVTPEASLFVDNQKEATAAVTLKLVPGTNLSNDQVRAVANLLAGSIESLKTENVTIVDTGGNILSDVLGSSGNAGVLSGSQYQQQQTVEENTRKSIQSMLDKVLGSGKTVVRINATLDFNQTTITKQTNGPGAIVSEQKSDSSTTNGTGTGGTAGVTSNSSPTYTTDATGTTSTSTTSSSTINHQVDTTQEQQVVAPGSVKRLNVSVMADADSVTQLQLDQIKTVVASAAGVDQSRGDQIQVAAIVFDKTDLLEETTAMDAAEKRQQLLTYLEIGAAVLFGILLLLMLRRSRSKKKRGTGNLLGLNGEQPLSLAAAELLMAQESAEEEAKYKLAQRKSKSVDEIQKQKTKESVEQYSRNSPEEVARLMKTWLSEES